MSDFNSMLIADAQGVVAYAAPSDYPKFGSSVSSPANSAKALGIDAPGAPADAKAFTTGPGEGLKSDYNNRPEVKAVAAQKEQQAAADAATLSRDEKAKLWGIKNAIESGQRPDLAAPGAAVAEINQKLGLTETHRGSDFNGKF